MASPIPVRVPTTWEINQPTGCCIWTGAYQAKAGRPTIWAWGNQMPASRWMFMRLHGQLPAGAQLLRLCPDVRCVSPYHHIVRSPETSVRRVGLRSSSLSMVKRLIVKVTAVDPTLRLAWRGPPKALECDPGSVAQLAAQVPGLPPFAILCGYAALALESKKDWPESAPALPGTADVVEARLAIKLAEFGDLGGDQ